MTSFKPGQVVKAVGFNPGNNSLLVEPTLASRLQGQLATVVEPSHKYVWPAGLIEVKWHNPNLASHYGPWFVERFVLGSCVDKEAW